MRGGRARHSVRAGMPRGRHAQSDGLTASTDRVTELKKFAQEIPFDKGAFVVLILLPEK